jgi:multisite-specific tRNA:(cytosine-C5)-methyltransferase
MVFPLWKSVHSLNLMLPKEDRRALLLRLFNDETPLVNLSSKSSKSVVSKAAVQVDRGTELEEVEQRRNSSSDDEDAVVEVPSVSGEKSGGRMRESLSAGEPRNYSSQG